MPVTIKCADCGHTKGSDDGAPEPCPKCEGPMAPPAQKAAPPEPAKRAKPAAREGNPRDGSAAEALGLAPGFDDAELMAQVGPNSNRARRSTSRAARR